MKKKEVLLNILKKNLKLNQKEIKDIKQNKIEKFQLGVHSNWDSLKHVVILNEISKKIKIKISNKNFENFFSLKKIFSFLKIKN